MTTLFDAAKILPLAERIRLAEALWESITLEGYEPELTAGQAAELDSRLTIHRQTPDDVVSWETVKDELGTKYGKPR